MKALTVKITLLCLLLLCLSIVLLFFAQAQTTEPSGKTEVSDSSKQEEGKFPFEAEEISISEDEIYIRTKDGKELLVGPEGKIHIPTEKGKRIILGGDEQTEQIIVENGKIRIGDIEINLKDLGDLEDLKDLEALKGLKGLEGLKALKGLEALQGITPVVKPPRVLVLPKASSTSEGVFKFGSDIVVEEDEEIDGDVVALGGNIQIKGSVTGNVVAIGGDVDVFSTGLVEGDAVSIGGHVTKRGQAEVRGEKVSVGLFTGPRFKFPFMGTQPSFIFHPFQLPAWAFFLRIFRILFFIFLGIVVISILPKNVTKIKEKVKHDFLKSGLVGLAAEILFLPIFILLIITIIGIPIALLVQPLFILAALILGYTGTCYFIGERLQEHTSLKPGTKIMILVIGILAVELVPLVGRMVGIFGGPLSPLALIITLIGWLIAYVVITVGLGASILTRLGTRPKDITPAPAVIKTSETDTN
jgi:hypothetical protein